MVTASWICGGNDTTPSIATIRCLTHRIDQTVGNATVSLHADAAATVLFGTHTTKSTILCPDGSEWLFDAILRQFGTDWLEAGYKLQPLVTGHQLKALIIRHGNRRWTLSDFHASTASTVDQALDDARSRRLMGAATNDDAMMLQTWCIGLQDALHPVTRTYLRATVGSASVRAAAFHLPDGIAVTRTLPLLSAMCRDGKGYRGGYVHAIMYRGPVTKVDGRRMYAWCLSQPLPYRWGIGRCIQDGNERHGIYVCAVNGMPRMPVQLPVWSPETHDVTTQLWTGGSATCILPSSEFAGLRALGCTVDPTYGFVATHWLSLETYIHALVALTTKHGSQSAVGRWCKLAANALYGRLAVNPHREGIVFAINRPAGRTFPLVTIDDVLVDNAWTIHTTHYAPSHQVGMAAWITGLARSRLYALIASVINAGRSVVHAHTDGIVATGCTNDGIPDDDGAIGSWRIEGMDADGIVVRAGGYAVGGEARWSGAPSSGRRTIEVAWDRGQWVVGGKRAYAVTDG
jgi:hypothetical protein